MSELNFWLVTGFVGQTLFTARFVVQWLASERSRDAVVPVAFWWLSLLGGSILLSYAIANRDPVFMTGQAMGLCIYVRNLMLVSKAARRARPLAPSGPHMKLPAARRAVSSTGGSSPG
ncbi:MAG: lipid-A-disaccharide synthase N-terminal domain-containing protein [Isosphaeraceae bacterium]